MPYARGTIRLAATLLATLLAATAPARAAQWSLADASPPGSVMADSAGAFADAVAKATGGAIAISGSGADAAGAVAAASSGRAALAVFPLEVLEGEHPVLGMDRVPYLALNYVHAAKLWNVLRPEVEKALSAKGMTLLYAIPGPPPAPLSLRALTSLEAFRGTRVLATEPALEALARLLGATVARRAAPREALGGGSADVTFLPAPQAAREQAWEYAGHYLHAPAWFPKHLVAVNRDALATLAATPRDALLTAADRAAADAWQRSETATAAGVQRLRDYGVKTAEPPVDMAIALDEMGRQLLYLWSETAGETGAELVERYFAVR